MINKTAEIVDYKKVIAKRLSFLANNLLKIVYNGLAEGRSKFQIKQMLTHEYNLPLWGSEKSIEILNAALRILNAADKKTRKDLKVIKNSDKDYTSRLEEQRCAVYKALKDIEAIDYLYKDRNLIAKNVESNLKAKEIGNLVDSGNIFFLLSSHDNPAKDHAAYQGKIYVNDNYKDIIAGYSDDKKKRIEAYISRQKVKTVGWVTGAPVYMITRPNCKHFFTPIPLDKVLETSVKNLAYQYDTHSTAEEVHNVSKYDQYIKIYKMRLSELRSLYKMSPCDSLYQDIKKTTELIKKWEYLGSQA